MSTVFVGKICIGTSMYIYIYIYLFNYIYTYAHIVSDTCLGTDLKMYKCCMPFREWLFFWKGWPTRWQESELIAMMLKANRDDVSWGSHVIDQLLNYWSWGSSEVDGLVSWYFELTWGDWWWWWWWWRWWLWWWWSDDSDSDDSDDSDFDYDYDNDVFYGVAKWTNVFGGWNHQATKTLHSTVAERIQSLHYLVQTMVPLCYVRSP